MSLYPEDPYYAAEAALAPIGTHPCFNCGEPTREADHWCRLCSEVNAKMLGRPEHQKGLAALRVPLWRECAASWREIAAKPETAEADRTVYLRWAELWEREAELWERKADSLEQQLEPDAAEAGR